MESRQVDEAMLALLHTILLHRSTGKFHYKKEGTYSIGTVGTQDVDCDFIDFTFVRVSSDELDRVIRKAVAEFKVLLITLFHLLDLFEKVTRLHFTIKVLYLDIVPW